jgi:hypothetical protein
MRRYMNSTVDTASLPNNQTTGNETGGAPHGLSNPFTSRTIFYITELPSGTALEMLCCEARGSFSHALSMSPVETRRKCVLTEGQIRAVVIGKVIPSNVI